MSSVSRKTSRGRRKGDKVAKQAARRSKFGLSKSAKTGLAKQARKHLPLAARAGLTKKAGKAMKRNMSKVAEEAGRIGLGIELHRIETLANRKK